MLKQSVLRIITGAAIGILLFTSNAGWAQTAKIVVEGNVGIGTTSPTQPVEAAGIIYSNTGGFKFPDATIQTSAAGITVGTNTLSIVNNIGGGNTSTGQWSVIGSGMNQTISGSADFAVILGGRNNAIEATTLNFAPGVPAPANPGSHNFISSGEFNKIQPNANHAAIIGGRNNIVASGAVNSIILGGSNITATEPNTVYMQRVAVTSLADSAEPSLLRMVFIDQYGNLKTSPGGGIPGNPACLNLKPFWETIGNPVPPGCDPVIGTLDPYPFKIITNKVPRMTVSAVGDVGINTTNPGAKLHVNGNTLIGGKLTVGLGNGNPPPIQTLDVNGGINVANGIIQRGTPTITTGDLGLYSLEDGLSERFVTKNGSFWFSSDGNPWSNAPLLAIDPNGHVGIGTATPKAKLDVIGGVLFSDNAANEFGTNYATPGGLRLDVRGDARFSHSQNPSNYVRIAHDGGSGIIDVFGAGGLLINYYSKKGVAVGGPMSVCGKLTVHGVGCDFVFADDYQKMPWQERELYYKTHKRLPYIDPASEMEKDGIDIGANFTGLLHNVEESILDITELYKRVNEIAKQNEKLLQLNKELQKEIAILQDKK
jgi:hypothetical protein